MDLLGKRIYIAGSSGMVGRALTERLQQSGFTSLILQNAHQLDLRRQQLVEDFFASKRPEIVVVAAAKVGGILANNTYRAEFIYDNISIVSNIVNSAYRFGVEKLIYLGSSCIYPRDCPQPIKEEYLLTAPLEKTNEPYAIAKIAGVKLCENYFRQYGCNFFSVMPTNLYGPKDNFDLESSHVIPALIRKVHQAKLNGSPSVAVWGSGAPKREFMYVGDLAEALEFLLLNVNVEDICSTGVFHVNVGTGQDLSIHELAKLVSRTIMYGGAIEFDGTKPDGTPRKLLDVSRLNELGWKSSTMLEAGLAKTYRWFQDHMSKSHR